MNSLLFWINSVSTLKLSSLDDLKSSSELLQNLCSTLSIDFSSIRHLQSSSSFELAKSIFRAAVNGPQRHSIIQNILNMPHHTQLFLKDILQDISSPISYQIELSSPSCPDSPAFPQPDLLSSFNVRNESSIIDDLRRKLKQESEARIQAESQVVELSSIKKSYASLQDEYLLATSKLKQLQHLESSLESNKTKNSELKSIKDQLFRMTSTNTSLRKKVNDLQQELTRLKSLDSEQTVLFENEKLKEKLSILSEENSSLLLEVTRLKANQVTSPRESESDDEQSQLIADSWKLTIEELNTRVSELEEANYDLDLKNSNLIRENSDTKQQNLELSNENMGLRHDIEQLKSCSTCASLSEKIKKLSSEREKLKKAYLLNRQQLEEAQETLSQLATSSTSKSLVSDDYQMLQDYAIGLETECAELRQRAGIAGKSTQREQEILLSTLYSMGKHFNRGMLCNRCQSKDSKRFG
ncbi:hypothetical protein GEMRC1_007771 [Eukaryota sp. GEM-RC1]